MKSIIRHFHPSDHVPVKLDDDHLRQRQVDAADHHQLKKRNTKTGRRSEWKDRLWWMAGKTFIICE